MKCGLKPFVFPRTTDGPLACTVPPVCLGATRPRRSGEPKQSEQSAPTFSSLFWRRKVSPSIPALPPFYRYMASPGRPRREPHRRLVARGESPLIFFTWGKEIRTQEFCNKGEERRGKTTRKGSTPRSPPLGRTLQTSVLISVPYTASAANSDESQLLIRTSGSGRAHLYQFRVPTGASILGEILIQVEYKKTFTQSCYCQGSVTQMNSLPFSDLPDASAQISVWRLKTVT